MQPHPTVMLQCPEAYLYITQPGRNVNLWTSLILYNCWKKNYNMNRKNSHLKQRVQGPITAENLFVALMSLRRYKQICLCEIQIHTADQHQLPLGVFRAVIEAALWSQTETSLLKFGTCMLQAIRLSAKPSLEETEHPTVRCQKVNRNSLEAHATQPSNKWRTTTQTNLPPKIK